MKTSEVLNKAADLIEERGWVRGQGWVRPLDPEDSPLCLEGGIQAAAGITWQEIESSDFRVLSGCPAYRAVADHLDTRVLYNWNDHAVKGAAEVIEVLRATAVIEAAREDAAAPVQVTA